MTAVLDKETRVRRRLEILILVLLCLLAVNRAAQAQATRPSGDAAAGYSSLTDVTSDSSSSDRYTGWLASAAWPVLGRKILATGEVGSNWRSNVVSETQRLTSVLGGARYLVTQSPRVVTFVQGQVGMERFSEPGFDESGLAMQPGAGVDVYLTSLLGVRAQADMRFSKQNDVSYREVRVAVEAVLRLKRR